jgi:hypothetical protein
MDWHTCPNFENSEHGVAIFPTPFGGVTPAGLRRRRRRLSQRLAASTSSCRRCDGHTNERLTLVRHLAISYSDGNKLH